jgi:predicted DNA-binding transcriptional regulator AlpA
MEISGRYPISPLLSDPKESPHNFHHILFLTWVLVNVYIVYMCAEIQTGHSTGQVAAAIGVAKKTLLRWLEAGELPEPNTLALGRINYRVWSDEELDRAKQYRESHYRKKRS